MATTTQQNYRMSHFGLNFSPLAVNFATAGMGGMMGWTVVHPFNTVCVRMNLASAVAAASGGVKSKSLSFPSYLSMMVKEQGAMSLYSGLSAGLLRQLFYTTSRLGLFEVFRDELAKYRPTDIWSRLSTGMVSGGIAAVISCPAEVTLVRISNDKSLPEKLRRNYKGLADAFQRILKEEGASTFFSGSGPLVNRAMLVGAVQVGTYDQFRQTFRGWGITDQFSNVVAASMVSAHILIISMKGLIMAVVTMPLETSKNRMAFQTADPTTGKVPYTGLLQTMTSIVKKEGPKGLYEGFSPYYIRCGGQTLLMFLSVEWLRKIYIAIK